MHDQANIERIYTVRVIILEYIYYSTTCPAFNHIRCNLFAECSLITSSLTQVLKKDTLSSHTQIYSMYIHRKSNFSFIPINF